MQALLVFWRDASTIRLLTFAGQERRELVPGTEATHTANKASLVPCRDGRVHRKKRRAGNTIPALSAAIDQANDEKKGQEIWTRAGREVRGKTRPVPQHAVITGPKREGAARLDTRCGLGSTMGTPC